MTDNGSDNTPSALPDPCKSKQDRLLAEYATKADLVVAFKVSSRTIERWVRMRVLPAPVRLGRTSLFHLPSVQEHLLRGASSRAAGRGRQAK